MSTCSTHPLGQLLEERRVVDGMHRVQAQAVEAVFEQPHQRIVDKEVAHFAAAKSMPGAPGRVAVFAEKAFGVLAQVVAVGAEVVVDHIENHRQAMLVGPVDQVFRTARVCPGRLAAHRAAPRRSPSYARRGHCARGISSIGGDAQLGQAWQVLLDSAVAPRTPTCSS